MTYQGQPSESGIQKVHLNALHVGDVLQLNTTAYMYRLVIQKVGGKVIAQAMQREVPRPDLSVEPVWMGCAGPVEVRGSSKGVYRREVQSEDGNKYQQYIAVDDAIGEVAVGHHVWLMLTDPEDPALHITPPVADMQVFQAPKK